MDLSTNYEYETRWCRGCGAKFKVVKGLCGNPRKYCSPRCRKLHWDRANRWKYQNQCPSCGGLKMKHAKTCRRCMPGNNPEGHN